MSTDSARRPSWVRSGARAGASYFGSVIRWSLFGIVASPAVLWFYLHQMDQAQLLQGPGMPAAAHAGGAGAALGAVTLLFQPAWLVFVVLLLYPVVYGWVGAQRGRAGAMRHLVGAQGEVLSQRLADAVADRIESLPGAHRAMSAMGRTADWLSADVLVAKLAPVIGQGKVAKAIVPFILKRLPMEELLSQWRTARVDQGALPVAGDVLPRDTVLRGMLQTRIHESLEELAAPSPTPLYVALGVHAATLGLGLWLIPA
jgi:hypothetical protein